MNRTKNLWLTLVKIDACLHTEKTVTQGIEDDFTAIINNNRQMDLIFIMKIMNNYIINQHNWNRNQIDM